MSSTISAGTTSGTALAMAGDTSGSLQLQTNGTTTAVTIDTSQNVGIGTTSPTDSDSFGRTIDAVGTNGAAYYTRYSGNTANYGFYGTSINGTYLGQGGALPVIFYTTNTERMRIDSSGNLLVGTTTAAPTAPFNGTAVAGVFRTIATSGSVTNGGNTTLFTITVDTVYLVTVQTQNASGLSTTAIVRYVTGGNPVATTTLYADNAGFAVTVSGTAVRITNNLGGNVAFTHSSVRIY